MIKEEYYKPVEQRLRENHYGERQDLAAGRTEEFPQEMSARQKSERESLERERMTLNHIQWFQLYPEARQESQGIER